MLFRSQYRKSISINIRHSSGKERAFIEILFLYCLHLMNFVTVILDYQSLKERTMKTKQKIQFNRGHASVKYLIAFLFIACGGRLLARNMHKDRKGSFEVDEKRKKFLYSIDSASLLCIKKQVLILNQHLFFYA